MNYHLWLCTALLLGAMSLPGQVGVNTPTPEQALDVNGKIRLADDSTLPSDGTLRYDEPSGDFQGYSDGEWKTLGKRVSGPTNPVPYVGYTSATGVGTSETVNWVPWTSTEVFQTVPPGKFLLVTQIYYRDNNVPNDDRFVAASLRVNRASFGYAPRLYWLGLESTLLPFKGSLQDPVFILLPGDSFIFTHSSTSEETHIHAEVRGFLVDDLDF